MAPERKPDSESKPVLIMTPNLPSLQYRLPLLTAISQFLRIPSQCSLDFIRSTSTSSPLSPGCDGCTINTHERRKTLISVLYTSLRRSSFCPFPAPTIFPDYSMNSQLFFKNSLRSTNSTKASNIQSNTSGSSENFPLIPSTSPDHPLRHYLFVHWVIKLSGVLGFLGMRHGISRRWWPYAANSSPPTYRPVESIPFPSPLLYPWRRQSTQNSFAPDFPSSCWMKSLNVFGTR
jgi:hypothetical protein